MSRSTNRYFEEKKFQHAKCKFCGKNVYKTENEARKVADEQESLSMFKEEISVYKCQYGYGWHLTSKKKKE